MSPYKRYRRVRIVPGDSVEIYRGMNVPTTLITVEDVWPEVGLVALNEQGFPKIYPWASMLHVSVYSRLGAHGQEEWDKAREDDKA
jgi:hypothetical protein